MRTRGSGMVGREYTATRIIGAEGASHRPGELYPVSGMPMSGHGSAHRLILNDSFPIDHSTQCAVKRMRM